MKIKLFSSSGIFQNNVFLDGFTLIDFLTLYRNPESPSEAATKRYVDSFPSVFDVSVISGKPIRNANLIGGIGGDLVGFNGTDVYLSSTGVQPGVYNRVSVNEKGRVIAAQQVPGGGPSILPFTNITSRPTTTVGYIGDTTGYAIKTNGFNSNVEIDGNLLSEVTPTLPNHVATQAYVAGKTAGMVGRPPVGSLKISTIGVAGAEYLRANGGVISKTTYAALYAIIGDTYSIDPLGFMGQPWRQQYAFNDQTNSASLTWSSGTNLPITVGSSQAVVTKSRVYILGYYSGSGTGAGVYSSMLNPDGTLVGWQLETSLPTPLYATQAFVTKNRLYLLGGYDGTTTISAVRYAPINADGTLGSWVVGPSLPKELAHAQLVVTTKRVYLLAGSNNAGHTKAVYSAPISLDGSLGSWVIEPDFPYFIRNASVVTTKNRVYLIGGQDANGSLSVIYTALVNSDGTLGSWSSAGSFPIPVSHTQPIVTKSRVYILGGYSANTSKNTVYTAPINTDGTLGSWSLGTNLPSPQHGGQAVVTNGYIYLLGGYSDANTTVSTVYQTPFLGGVNDYIAVILSNTINPTSQFKLPDHSDKTYGPLEYFIRALP